MIQIQITLTSTMGNRPISTLIEVKSVKDFNENQKEYKKLAKTRMCVQRNWSGTADLEKYGYTQLKARVYDKEKIDKENKERYEKIKKERGWA